MSEQNSCCTTPGEVQSPVRSISSGDADDGIREDFCNDLMTSSYTEISFDHSDDEETDEIVDEVVGDEQNLTEASRQMSKVSASLSLPQLSSTIVNWSERTKASYETENLQLASTSSGENVVTDDYEGPMVSFVAKDFEEKLNLSHSLASIEKDIPQIDLKILRNLEDQAKQLSANINLMLNYITESSQMTTSLTVECTSSYEDCLNKTCDVVDSNIKAMYQLMAKCEELSSSMRGINKISEELKEVKRLLDLFEKTVDSNQTKM